MLVDKQLMCNCFHIMFTVLVEVMWVGWSGIIFSTFNNHHHHFKDELQYQMVHLRLLTTLNTVLIGWITSPFNPSNKEHQVAIDFGAVDKVVNVAWVHCLSCLEAGCAYSITCCTTQREKISFIQLIILLFM